MDPISRRAVWDAINGAKQAAAVVLTTHSMEEADALGDRIAIMVRGRMRVLGGSLTLKQKYGNGYQLRLRMLHNQPQQFVLPADQHQQQLHLPQPLDGQQLSHRGSGVPGATQDPVPSSSSPWLPMSPKASQISTTYFSSDGGALAGNQGGGGGGTADIVAGSRRLSGALAAAADECMVLTGGPGGVLQRLIADRLGLIATEETKQMLHYVIPQVRQG